MTDMQWLEPVPPPPDGGRLMAALWTTYRPVDAAFLAADVLPRLVGLAAPDGEDQGERNFFIGEVMNALSPLQGKLTLISSSPAVGSGASTDDWLWRYVTPYMVGHNKRCIQHAKLWLFQWDVGGQEQLQIVVSSTNLTRDAFRGQIQAGWSATIPLNDGPVKDGQRASGLMEFIKELGVSANCTERTKHWISVLERAIFPKEVHFVASIPTKASPLASWPLKKTGKLKRILVPFVGPWSAKDASAWRQVICGRTGTVDLVWPSNKHPWAHGCDDDGRTAWRLPETALTTIVDCSSKFSLKRLPEQPPVLKGATDDDPRWGHLKLYGMENGCLIGSHNWSKAAWGLPKVSPENFELSVFVPDMALPIDLRLRNLKACDAQSGPDPERQQGEDWMTWARAEWDGKSWWIEWRATKPVTVEWRSDSEWCEASSRPSNCSRLKGQESDVQRAPRHVRFFIPSQPDDARVITVIDVRPGTCEVPAGIPVAAAEIADQLLLESYGGPPAEPPSNRRAPRTNDKRWHDDCGADYRTKWLISARTWFQVVDNWRAMLGTDPQRATQDAARMVLVLNRRAEIDGVGARLAAGEIEELRDKA
jgi:hypothetical protein